MPDRKTSTEIDAATVTTGTLMTCLTVTPASATCAVACLLSAVAAPTRNEPIKASHSPPRLRSGNRQNSP